MKKIFLFSLALAACLLSCTKEESTGSKAVFAMLPDNNVTARWAMDKKYIQEAASGFNLELTVKTYDESNQSAKQVEDITNAINSGVKNFIITPIDYEALNNAKVFEGHNDLNIVSHDRMIYNNAAVDAYSSCDVYDVGALQAEYVIGRLLASGEKSMTLEILAGPSSDNNSSILFNGVYEGLKSYLDNGMLKIVSGKTIFAQVSLPSWNSSDAKNEMTSRLDTYYPNKALPDIIICPNDNCATGVIEAVAAHVPGISEYPIIIGQDNDSATATLIKDGKMSMTVDKSIRDMAYNSVTVLVNMMKGVEPTSSSYFDNGVRYVPFIKSTPKVVTKATLE